MSKRRLFIVFLALFFSLGSGIFFGLYAAELSRPSFAQISQTDVLAIKANDVKSEVNLYRSQNGKQSLTDNAVLAASAQSRAEFLCKNNIWSHDGWVASVAGYMKDARGAGENLEYTDAYATAGTVVSNWSKSPSHNAAMLDPKYTEQGMGVVYCKQYQGQQGVVILVNHFGDPS